jgi:hypothetical protein
MMPDTKRLQATVAHVDALLHAGRYRDLEELSRGERLTAEEIAVAIRDYPERLAPRPTYDVEDLSVVYVRDSVPAKWSVYLHLCRAEGGRSDLTAELTLKDTPSGLYAVEIDDIHVL